MAASFLKKPWVQAALVFLVLLLILFNGVFFRGEVFGGGDTTAAKGMTVELRQYMAETGEYPFWQPYIFSGMPAFSSLMFTRLVYFPGIVLGWLNGLGVPGLWNMILHYLFAAMGVYLLLRRLQMDQIPALLGGTAYMLTPFFVVMLTAGHGSQAMTAAYLPWLLYGLIRLFREPGLRSALILTLLVGFQLQRGHVQVAYYGWMLMGLYTLFEIVSALRSGQGRALLTTLGWMSGALIVGIGLATVLYLPSLAYADYSIRGGSAAGGLDYAYATGWSFPPYEMLTFLVPDWFGFGGASYWGGRPFTEHSDFFGIVWILLVLAAFLNRDQFRTKLYLLVAALLALLISFGSYFPVLYDPLFRFLPFFDKFRVPSMILILVAVCFAVLAGYGLQAVAGLTTERKRSMARPALILLAVSGGLTILVLLARGGLETWMGGIVAASPKSNPGVNGQRVDMWYGSLLLTLFMSTAALGIFWAWVRGKVPPSLVLGVLPLLLVADLLHVDFRFTERGVPARVIRNLESASPAVRQLQALTEKEPGRIFPVMQLFAKNDLALHSLESIGGYSPAKLELYQDFLEYQDLERGFLMKYYEQTADGVRARTLEEIDPVLRRRHLGALRTLDVHFILSPYPIPEPEFKLLGQSNHLVNGQRLPVVLYHFEGVGDRVWIARNVHYLDSIAAVRALMEEPSFDPGRDAAVLAAAGDEMTGTSDSTAMIRDIRSDLQHMEIDYVSEQPQFLIVSEIYYPNGWRAHLEDGGQVDILRVNDIIRGIQVPAGEHTVTFEYHPASIRAGFTLTLISTLLCLAALIWLSLQTWRTRRSEDQD